MSREDIHTVPSQAELERADPQGFVLQVAPGQGIRVTLAGVYPEVAMNERYECYSFVLSLPEGVALPSQVYRLFGPEQQAWLLLLTPVMPGADGRPLLEAVIHREKAAQQ
ncbi:TPA: hypothetical protein QEM39_000524 [Pseudomonas putida]|jgi:hypothetical protein|uniref:DUF6916 family protein n=1 Tax=Pseudomonas TaxID=286 RepID=UPI00047F69C2|nr:MULTISPECIES: hypothetical protein [Pseudomonas]MDD2150641.1 hypothetical protein [Pseudomonas putida]RAS20686.1 hypothetical protein H040_05236 [Pseudomonas sp. URMO17WK12:I7]SMF69822.1 hypothetical protein SAMN02745903_05185 [Pseudomonas sp. URMO17WK12:I5]HDS1679053.1 hypothetical protein [Pseudomonas putida]